MRSTLALCLLAALSACRTSRLGACTSDAQCPLGSTCDLAAAVCLAKAGTCLPSCDATHVCNSTTLACDAAQTPQVAVVSPAEGAVVSGTLQAVATAHAPGGVSAVRFELRSTGGALLAFGDGVAAAATWTASIPLAGFAEGPALLSAVATHPQGATTSADVHVTVQQNACFPSCPAGKICQSGSCVASSCTPVCDAAHVCNNGTCQPAVSAAIVITSPAANAFAARTLQTTATASAPGGISSLRFDLSRGGTVIASAPAATSPGNLSNYSAAIPLASVADGPATLTATLTAAAGNATSAPVTVTVDQTPPAITLQTDGRMSFFGAGQTATVVAQITDAVSGVQDSTVSLLLSGHAALPGVPGAGGTYSFPVLIDGSIVAAGASAALPFQIVASNKAGQPATLAGDPGEVIQADRDAPSITAVNYLPAALNGPSGHLLLGGPAGGSAMVRATIADFSGVAPPSVCLRLPGETSACQHPGTRLIATTTWTFALPRPAAPQDGTAATVFTLEADDTLAASLSGTSQAEHQARSPQTVYFDYGPTIAVSADPAPYARTAVTIPVAALITDPSGVPDGGVFLNGTLQPSSRDGGLFVFQLDPGSAQAGVEGAYSFQVSATDGLGITADAGGSRIIDDAPPDASVRVFSGTDPGTSGVTYPAAVAGTGWDGTQFIYNDTVHVKGTLTDLSGLASAVVHIDYLQVDGGLSAGTTHPLGCTSGATSCAFDLPIALNAPGNGTFNTFKATHPMGDILAPSDKLKIVIASTDAARSADGAPAAHTGASSSDAQTTRLLWQIYLPASVSGLGVHPDGDLIVTLDGGTDTVCALRPDDGGVHWAFGGGVALGAVDGTPAVGVGDGGNARVYVAAQDGGVFAIDPNGVEAWHYYTGDTLNVGPALTTATIASVAVEEVIVDGALKTTSNLYNIVNGNLLSSKTVADANSSSAPLILGGSIYYGTATSIASHTLSGTTGALGNATDASAFLAATTYDEVITDGTDLFSWRNLANGIVSVDAALTTRRWTKGLTPTGAPAVALSGSLVVPLSNGSVNSFSTSNGSNSLLLNLGGSGRAPLVGWDGQSSHEHFYFPRLAAVLFAYDASGNEAWEADLVKGTVYRATTMDCSGRLFAASSAVTGNKSLVYALITDDRGLADTPWPSYRLDARNTGNIASTSGIFLTGGACTQ